MNNLCIVHFINYWCTNHAYYNWSTYPFRSIFIVDYHLLVRSKPYTGIRSFHEFPTYRFESKSNEFSSIAVYYCLREFIFHSSHVTKLSVRTCTYVHGVQVDKKWIETNCLEKMYKSCLCIYVYITRNKDNSRQVVIGINFSTELAFQSVYFILCTFNSSIVREQTTNPS